MSTAIVDRVGRPYVIEAVRMLEAGEASVAAVDTALQAAGYPRGPFRLLDQVGLDRDLIVDRAQRDGHPYSDRFDPPQLQERLVEEGRVGAAAGRGFYRYSDPDAPMPDVAVELDVATASVVALSDEAIVERLELGVINEAYRAVEDGMASPPAIDEAMCQLAGYPYGPFQRVDQLGLRFVIERLRAMHALTEERSGDQYLVAAALWQIGTV